MSDAERLREEILRIIWDSHEKSGYSPTLSELTDMVGDRGKSTIRHHLKVLSQRGLIAIRPRKHRGIVPLYQVDHYEDPAIEDILEEVRDILLDALVWDKNIWARRTVYPDQVPELAKEVSKRYRELYYDE